MANIFSEYNQQDASFLNVFISVRRSTCFRQFSVHHLELKTAHTVTMLGCVYLSNTTNNIFSKYNQQDASFLNVFISVRRSTCFRQFSVHHLELKTAHTVTMLGCAYLSNKTNGGIEYV